jgi:hypothetical protein
MDSTGGASESTNIVPYRLEKINKRMEMTQFDMVEAKDEGLGRSYVAINLNSTNT